MVALGDVMAACRAQKGVSQEGCGDGESEVQSADARDRAESAEQIAGAEARTSTHRRGR